MNFNLSSLAVCRGVRSLSKALVRASYRFAVRHDREAYRCVQAVRLGGAIYVQHAFQKKSRTGIATPRQDVDLIRQRYREAKVLANEEEN